ncbi:hypothetical protein MBLNU13_g04224t1 [Cladosporium sp. NU13]
MTFQQELSSWFAPRDKDTIPDPPSIGSKAPSTSKIQLSSTPLIIAFLRHCGCPFAEKTFLNLRETARAHRAISFVAVSHSSQSATDTWLASLPQAGSEPDNLQIVVDEEREVLRTVLNRFVEFCSGLFQHTRHIFHVFLSIHRLRNGDVDFVSPERLQVLFHDLFVSFVVACW